MEKEKTFPLCNQCKLSKWYRNPLQSCYGKRQPSGQPKVPTLQWPDRAHRPLPLHFTGGECLDWSKTWKVGTGKECDVFGLATSNALFWAYFFGFDEPVYLVDEQAFWMAHSRLKSKSIQNRLVQSRVLPCLK